MIKCKQFTQSWSISLITPVHLQQVCACSVSVDTHWTADWKMTVTLDNHLGTLDDRLGTLDNYLKTLNGCLETHCPWTLDDRLGTLHGRLEALDSHLGTLDNHLITLDDHIRTLDNCLGVLGGHLGILDNHMGKLDDCLGKKWTALQKHWMTIWKHWMVVWDSTACLETLNDHLGTLDNCLVTPTRHLGIPDSCVGKLHAASGESECILIITVSSICGRQKREITTNTSCVRRAFFPPICSQVLKITVVWGSLQTSYEVWKLSSTVQVCLNELLL